MKKTPSQKIISTINLCNEAIRLQEDRYISLIKETHPDMKNLAISSRAATSAMRAVVDSLKGDECMLKIFANKY